MKEGWEYKKFSEVFDLQMGRTPARDNFAYWNDGANLWVSIGDMGKGKYLQSTKETISDKAVQETGIAKVSKGTVIMSFKLSIGKTAIASEDLYTNEAIMAFPAKVGYNLSSDFLYYYLQQYKWDTNRATMGATINKRTISDSIISIPPLAIQQQIVNELDTIHSILDKKNEQLKELDKLAQAIFYDMFGDPVTNEKGWEVKKLGEVCDVRDGTHDSPSYLQHSEYVLITSKNIKDGTIDFNISVNYISKEDFDAINKRSRVDIGDILMPMIGTIGNPIIVKPTNQKYSVKNVALIKFGTSDIINVFVKYLIDNPSYMAFLLSLNKGGTQKFVALGTIRNLPVPLPPLPLQQSFAAKVEAIEAQKELIRQSIREVEALLAQTMDKYFG